jgi:hypothetical protein
MSGQEHARVLEAQRVPADGYFQRGVREAPPTSPAPVTTDRTSSHVAQPVHRHSGEC